EDLFDVWRKRKGALTDAESNELLNAMHDLKQQFRSVRSLREDPPSTRPPVPKDVGTQGSTATGVGVRTGAESDRARNEVSALKAAVPDPEFGIHATPFQRQLLRESKGRSETLYRLDCEIDSAEPMAYARLYLVISNLEQNVHVISIYPDIETIRAGRSSFLQALVTSGEPEERILRAVNVDQIRKVDLQSLEYGPLLSGSDTDVDVDSGRKSPVRSFSVSMPGRLYEELCLNADEIHSRLSIEWTELSKAPIESGIRSRIQWNLFLVNRLVGWMRNEIAGFSTAPLSDLFHNLSGAVEELGRQLGKPVVLKTQGEHERVYLPVSDVLTDVLLHLIRNAIDHGIETPPVRKSRGKPEAGTIRLTATSTEEKLTIRVEDDGNGIPESLVRSMETGGERPDSISQVGSESNAMVDERDLLSIISRAGFTTRSKPGEVSGRGVGLDVVSYSVQKLLCGKIELENKPGHGCAFSLVLPLSTNLVTVLVLQAGDEYIALPRVFVSTTFEIDRRFVFTDSSETTYYRYSGENVRMYTVHENFPESLSLEAKRMGALIDIADERGVIVADRLVSEETVVQDRSRRSVVFSQVLNREVRVFLPSQLLSALSFKRTENR
ncbi:MAG TPA: ATP-binding protein, partial [Spirochaetia bacterium]|nr:ATP-binding protein [Spirochaetia bacterium]